MITAELTPTRNGRFWLPLPSRPAIYRLSTDHYPWSEVRSDLEARPMLSAVLEAEQQGRRGRLMWNAGAALGGFDDTRDLNVEAFTLAFPRATLQLALVDPATVGLAWQCRSAQPEALSVDWPQAQTQLASSHFSGALLGGEGGEVISFWQSGRPVAGSLPVSGSVQQLSATQQLGGQDLAAFWSKVLLLASAQANNVAEIWRSSAADLADDHPCLDPFAREVWVERLTVQAVPELSAAELRDALFAVFDATLRRLRLRLRSFPLADLTQLQASPLWSVSGAGDLM